MALKNQPYLPLYVQDFLTDEKLIECSAEATGVYIRLMCILHKSDEYGCILLKQKDKQTDSTIKNFALKISKQMPFDVSVIEKSLIELIEEKVLILEDDLLYQKRMKNDGILSNIKAEAGKKGAEKRYQNKKSANNFAIANDLAITIANTENEIEYENEYENNKVKEIIDYLNLKTNSHYRYSSEKTRKLIKARMTDRFTIDDFKKVIDNKSAEWIGTEFENYLRPETLFSNKFESYLNQKNNQPKKEYMSYQERKKIEEDKMWEDLKKKVESEKKLDN